ncbi:hypothetical protein [Endomicrobium proavitum]|uniref:Glycerophosphoryl diester phosphodiesterase membrane domain-containing protein n=1 Tax=Endomicrobium proavitum TaxID=1408281 RepID=A0A0G3WJ04_9BACT|nr:hypothetical protein [Endomicrobium proavitum]AKL98641.1 membrane protein of unknown function [Endomicrobium proavitum]
MSKAAFAIGDVLRDGWKGFKKNAKFLIVPLVLIFILVSVFYAAYFYFITLHRDYSGITLIVFLAGYLVYFLIAAYFSLSLIKATIDTAKGKKLSWDILVNDIGYYFRYLLAIILYVVVMLIIPALLGIIIAVAGLQTNAVILVAALAISIIIALIAAFVFYPVIFFAADKDQKFDIVKFFVKSYEIVTKNLGQLVLYALAIIGILILAYIALLIAGFLVSMILTIIIYATSAGNTTVIASIVSIAVFRLLALAVYIVVVLPIYVSFAEVYKKLVYTRKK